MFILLTYDVEAKRTNKFRKLLSKYLGHEQFSVFFGELPESGVEKLRLELRALMIGNDRVLEIVSENRHNVSIFSWTKDGRDGGIPARIADDRHKRDSIVI